MTKGWLAATEFSVQRLLIQSFRTAFSTGYSSLTQVFSCCYHTLVSQGSLLLNVPPSITKHSLCELLHAPIYALRLVRLLMWVRWTEQVTC